MTPDHTYKDALPRITEELTGTYHVCQRTSHLGHSPLPSREAVADILSDLCDLLFPGYWRRQNLHLGNVVYYVGDVLDGLYDKVQKQISRAFRHDQAAPLPRSEIEATASEKAVAFLKLLPGIRRILDEDVQAALEGDPAAKSYAEIVFCYPGLYAITVYRLAHDLLKLGVPMIPRMMTEHAHSLTGIDIHPGANIGESFFIDHGTGVVIGETCDIGTHVKLYQGVTLGALSFPRDADGQLVRGRKRHPTLEDDVVVYANATILGGDTVVGHHAIIGSNVWLTHGVEPYTVVTLEKPSLRFRGQDKGFALNYQI
jgi:serine O-acetyltransferase